MYGIPHFARSSSRAKNCSFAYKLNLVVKMDIYLIVKFVHVVSAVVWLGGGFALLLLASVQVEKAEPARIMAVIAQVAYLGPRLFLPASILTLLSGLSAVYLGGFGWHAWIVFGFGGIAVTTLLGALKLGPMSDRVVALAKHKGPHAALSDAMTLIRLARFDYVMQFSIVFLMVAKPDWQDTTGLAIPALAVLLAAFMTVRPSARLVTNA
jgi:uncharacterized membrane protein